MSEAREITQPKEMVCIVCPVGCRLKAETSGGNLTISGHTCRKGERYALEELTNPTRTVTSSVPVSGGHMGLLSVKTARAVPKAAIPEVLKQLKCVNAQAPVRMGDVVLRDVAGTGVDIVATRSIRAE